MGAQAAQQQHQQNMQQNLQQMPNPFAAMNNGEGNPVGLQGAFAQVLQQNPEMFMQMLMQDPQIQQMAQADPQGFMQLVSDPNFINNVTQYKPSEYIKEHLTLEKSAQSLVSIFQRISTDKFDKLEKGNEFFIKTNISFIKKLQFTRRQFIKVRRKVKNALR